MEGMLMPPLPEKIFVTAMKEVIKRNKDLGFTPAFDPHGKRTTSFPDTPFTSDPSRIPSPASV